MFEVVTSFVKSFFNWLRSVYSESDGSGSSTRVHISLVFAFILGVGTSFCVSVHHKLITIEQFDAFLTAAGGFIAVVSGVLYGMNRTSEYLNNRLQAQGQQQNPPQS